MNRSPARRVRSRTTTLCSAAAIVALTLSACGTNGTGDSTNGTGGVGKVRAGARGTVAQLKTMAEVCGGKPITVAHIDGAQNSWRRVAHAELLDEAAKCPNITKVTYHNAQGDPSKMISEINAAVAKGVDVIVILPDSGDALLPTLRRAMQRGVAVVPWAVGTLGGTPAVDYVDAPTFDGVAMGRAWAEWMVKRLDGKGDIVFLGGTPGNPASLSEAEGIKQVLARHPGMRLLGDGPIDTNWDQAQAQKVMSGLLSKHAKIDGVIADSGLVSAGAIRAFVNAGRPLVPWSAGDINELACLYQEHKPKNENFELSTISSYTWIIRLALRKGVAAASGKPNDEPSVIEVPFTEDSTAGGDLAPKCKPDLPPDATLSAQLPTEKLAQLFTSGG
ncbi:substrate-binding domain-containing protein [Streptosporangium canum]|uniref:substrate-binding domain-containing protein n=1 Tax=Streptosporangium canum TaxID=324952 RepID=UPI0037B98D29